MPYRCLVVAALATAAIPAIAQAGAADPAAISRGDGARAGAAAMRRDACQPNVVHSHPGGQPSHYAITLPLAAGCAASPGQPTAAIATE